MNVLCAPIRGMIENAEAEFTEYCELYGVMPHGLSQEEAIPAMLKKLKAGAVEIAEKELPINERHWVVRKMVARTVPATGRDEDGAAFIIEPCFDLAVEIARGWIYLYYRERIIIHCSQLKGAHV